MVILKDRDKTITNIHGITINHKEGDISLSIFIKCFLDYLRKTGMTDLYAVGGNGGSLAMKYWDIIPFPNFPKNKQDQIVGLYHNLTGYPKALNFKSFLEEDQKWNKRAGIMEIDKSIKQLKKQLNSVLDKIVNDEIVNLEFV